MEGFIWLVKVNIPRHVKAGDGRGVGIPGWEIPSPSRGMGSPRRDRQKWKSRTEILVRTQFMTSVQKDFIQSKFRMVLSLIDRWDCLFRQLT